MVKYIESTELPKIETIYNVVNSHLDEVTCLEIVPLLSHLVETKYAVNYDLIYISVARNISEDRKNQMDDYVSINYPGVYFIEYDNDIAAGYVEEQKGKS